MITCTKVFHNQKQDKRGKSYDLVNIITATDRYTIFDYAGEVVGLQDGDTLDIAGYEQKENEYNGKKSIVLSKPRKSGNSDLEGRVGRCEERLDAIAKYLKDQANR